jgi:hypothetical protein
MDRIIPPVSRRTFWLILAVMIVNAAINYVDRHRHEAEEMRRHGEIMAILTEKAVGRR